MILDSVRLSHLGPDGKFTGAERKRSFELNLCMRCGKPGQRANKCNLDNFRLNESRLEDGLTSGPGDQGKE